MTDKFDSLLEDVYKSLVSEAEPAGAEQTPLDKITPAAQKWKATPMLKRPFQRGKKNLKKSAELKDDAGKLWDGPVLAKLNKDAENQLKAIKRSVEV
jgi:hypothetical protein